MEGKPGEKRKGKKKKKGLENEKWNSQMMQFSDDAT